MRLAPLLALLLAAPALHAQIAPDPNRPEDYYPLHVGDVWEYGPSRSGTPNSSTFPFERRTVTRDTLAAGWRYAVVRTQRFRPDPTGGWIENVNVSLVRFDTVSASVRVRSPGGVESNLLGCRLDLPFPQGVCDGTGGYEFYYGDPAATILIGTTALTRATRRFAGAYPERTLAAGIGVVFQGCEACVSLKVIYARVDGVEYGQQLTSFTTPDPVPPENYFPLDIGNEWHYERKCNGPERSCGLNYDRVVKRVITEATVAGGQAYVVMREREYPTGPTSFHLLRYEPSTTEVVERRDDGSERAYTCPLGAPFDGYESCETPINQRQYLYVVDNSGGIKQFYDTGGAALGIKYSDGVGLLGTYSGIRTLTLKYASVRGEVVYGAPVVVGTQDEAGTAAFRLAAAPNPTDGALRLALTLPEAQTVRLEAFDALGRRVWQQSAALGSGAQSVPVDASAWAPGLYLVRASAGSASASARVVRR